MWWLRTCGTDTVDAESKSSTLSHLISSRIPPYLNSPISTHHYPLLMHRLFQINSHNGESALSWLECLVKNFLGAVSGLRGIGRDSSDMMAVFVDLPRHHVLHFVAERSSTRALFYKWDKVFRRLSGFILPFANHWLGLIPNHGCIRNGTLYMQVENMRVEVNKVR
ncbi:hypothetical protein AG1IA_06058 [Rhizoctonia solani AG-1 IA]|uniref:Uncharacterized protein n=1 Tax=Thanatephorus cucumeris (strain AG1-IA) TaxID=983506 RepID=L8WT42_THACA|nr:hypothetical protein AG1IA_06058 [Rhizoctonia solani AG-1 IA]